MTGERDGLVGARVFVAGGTGNVGRELVGALTEAGATVAVSSRSPQKLAALRRYLDETVAVSDAAERLVPIEGDVAHEIDGGRVAGIAVERLGGFDAAIASLGTFAPAESLLGSTGSALRSVLDSYVIAHHNVARALVPTLIEGGGSYVIINGMLGFGHTFPGAALVSVAGSAQARWAQLLMAELESTRVRVNEVVVYSSFGRPDDEVRNRGRVGKSDVTRYVVGLVNRRTGPHGKSIHLKGGAELVQ